MPTAITVDGHALLAWFGLLVAIVFIVVVIARMVRREQSVRSTRIGVFVERELFDPPETPDEISERNNSEI